MEHITRKVLRNESVTLEKQGLHSRDDERLEKHVLQQSEKTKRLDFLANFHLGTK